MARNFKAAYDELVKMQEQVLDKAELGDWAAKYLKDIKYSLSRMWELSGE